MRTSASLLRWLPCLLLLSTAQASLTCKDQLKTLGKENLFGQEFSNLQDWKRDETTENWKAHAYAHKFSWFFGWVFWILHFFSQFMSFGLGLALFSFTEKGHGENNHLTQTLIFPFIFIAALCLSWALPSFALKKEEKKEFECKNVCREPWNYRVWALVIMAVAWGMYTISYDATVGTNDQATNETSFIIDKIHIESWLRNVLPMNCGFHWALTLCVPYTGKGHSCVTSATTWFWEKITWCLEEFGNHWSITNEFKNLKEVSKKETCNWYLSACFYTIWALTTPFLFSGFIFEWMSGQGVGFITMAFSLSLCSCYVFPRVDKRSNSWQDLRKGADRRYNYRVIMMAFMGATALAYFTATGRQHTGQQGEEYLEAIFKGHSNEKEYVHHILMMIQWARKWLGWSLGLNIAFFSIYSCLVPIRKEKDLDSELINNNL